MHSEIDGTSLLLDVTLQPIHMWASGFHGAAEQYDRSARHETVSSYGSAIEQSDSGAVPSGLFVAFAYAGSLLLSLRFAFRRSSVLEKGQ